MNCDKKMQLLVAASILVAFAFFAFAWNPYVEQRVNGSLRDVGVDVRVASIRGQFPFMFTVGETRVGTFASLYGVRVRYHGTYNPFHVTRQRGELASADGTATLSLLGHDFDLDLKLVKVHRGGDGCDLDNHHDWCVFADVSIDGIDAAVTLQYGENSRVTIELPVAKLRVELTETSVHVTFGERDVFRGTITPAYSDTPPNAAAPEPWSRLELIFGSVCTVWANLLGELGQAGTDIKDVTYSFYGHGLHTMFEELHLYPTHSHGYEYGDDRRLHYAVRPLYLKARPMGLLQVENHDDAPIFNVDYDGERLLFLPPVSTALGDLRSVRVDLGSAQMHVDVGDMQIAVAGTEEGVNVQAGPLALDFTHDLLRVALRGGHYDDVRCVQGAATVYFDEPHMVLVDNVHARYGGAAVHAEGTYNLREDKADINVVTDGVQTHF